MWSGRQLSATSTRCTSKRTKRLVVPTGKAVRRGLRVARDAKPGTNGGREARELTERATRRLGGILDAYVGVKPLIA